MDDPKVNYDELRDRGRSYEKKIAAIVDEQTQWRLREVLIPEMIRRDLESICKVYGIPVSLLDSDYPRNY